MKNSIESGFGGMSEKESPPVKKELSEQERFEQETRNFFQRSENCGVAAYAELTGKVPKEKIEEIYRRQGWVLEDSVKRGALWFGDLNYQPEIPVRNPQEYIQVFKSFIKQRKQEAEKTEATTPEEINNFQGFNYCSSVDSKMYRTTAENWMYHLLAGKKENYEVWIKEVRTTLEGFGKTAMEVGDDKTYNLVQETLRELE